MGYMEQKDLISISEAAEIIGVSIDTLRRWDKSGKLSSTKSPGGHRLYSKSQIEIYLKDIFGLAKEWVLKEVEMPLEFYCSNSSTFQARLTRMQDDLAKVQGLTEIFPLVVAIAGEIGNNSFDHNLGSWPDISGIFFGYDAHKKRIVLADRGRGIFSTLKRVKPSLETDEGALRTAFTEILSGRAPESRGNGLKFVKRVVAKNPIQLLFQSGNAELEIIKDGDNLFIRKSPYNFRGCLALITF